MQYSNSIAILKMAALGDICMTLPLVATLRAVFPNTRLYWIIQPHMAEFLQDLPEVEFISIPKPRSMLDYWRTYRQLKHYKFDTLLVPQASLRINLICPLIRARAKYGFAKLHSKDLHNLFINHTVISMPEHSIVSILRFAQALGVSEQQFITKVKLPGIDAMQQWAQYILHHYPRRKWLAVCPTASKVERNWSVGHYIETINRLASHWKFNLLLIGGNNALEIQRAEQISQGTRVCIPTLNLVAKTSLRQLSGLLASVDVLLAPDTGPLHIADLLGTPVVGLFAVAPPAKTGPYYDTRWVVDYYPQALRKILHIEPQQASWRQRVRTPKAMELITVDSVVSKCQELFTALGIQYNPK